MLTDNCDVNYIQSFTSFKVIWQSTLFYYLLSSKYYDDLCFFIDNNIIFLAATQFFS